MKWGRLVKTGAVSGILAAGLFLFDHVFGIPHAVGYQNTSLAEMLSRRDFDSQTWKQAAKYNGTIRLRMVDALLRKHRLVGMSRSQVEALLGPPDNTRYLHYDYVYWLGPERGFLSIDEEWLGINFKNDTAIEAKDVRD